ncbi:MAG: energy transducer TonB [Acidobacteriota bacterium]
MRATYRWLGPAFAALAVACLAHSAEPPLSIGTAALLVLEPPGEATAAKIAAGLSSDQAGVRGAAARVAGARSPESGCASLKATLDAEKDPEAAREEIRAIASVCPDASLFLTGKLPGLPRALPTEVAYALARRLGLGAGPLAFGVLRGALDSPVSAERFFRIAARGAPENATSLALMAVGADDAGAFRAIARNAYRDGVLPSPEVLRTAMASPNDGIAAAAAWLAALSNAARASAERATWASLPLRADSADPDLLFALDVLRRVAGGAPPAAAPWLQALREGASVGLDDVPATHPVFVFLTGDEKAALAARKAPVSGARALARPRTVVKLGRGSPRPVAERAPLVRTVTDLPHGVAAGLAAVSGCMLSIPAIALAEVTVRANGTPEVVKPLFMPADAGCRKTALALFALSLPPGDYFPPAGAPDRLAVVFDPDALDAIDEDAVGTPDVRTIVTGGPVAEPKEIRRVKPEYPESLRRARQGGVVVLTARIDTQGRVKDVRVVEPAGSLSVLLRDGTTIDLEALRSVARWRYEPARLAGVPVPVHLSVSVSFSVSGAGMPLSSPSMLH